MIMIHQIYNSRKYPYILSDLINESGIMILMLVCLQIWSNNQIIVFIILVPLKYMNVK
jgi:hypothetical protein